MELCRRKGKEMLMGQGRVLGTYLGMELHPHLLGVPQSCPQHSVPTSIAMVSGTSWQGEAQGAEG